MIGAPDIVVSVLGELVDDVGSQVDLESDFDSWWSILREDVVRRIKLRVRLPDLIAVVVTIGEVERLIGQ